MNQYSEFKALHTAKEPLILGNVWNVQSAKALENAGYNWNAGAGYHTARNLTEAFLDNLESLCEGARLELSEEELSLLDEWIGYFPDEPATAAGD